MSAPAPSISVVVPCHDVAADGGAAIRACIESLRVQDHAAHEIIAVDDASDDGTGDVLEQLPVRLVSRSENGGAGAARADGAQAATGSIVAFLDADCIAPPAWLSIIAEAFEDPNLGGVGGGYEHLPPPTWQGLIGALEEEFAHAVFARQATDAIPPGGNCAYRREIWQQARTGRESQHFRGMGSGEDTVAGHDIKRHARVEFRPQLNVLHSARNEGGFFGRHLNRGLSRTAILTKRLTDGSESRLAFAAYGGPSLAAGSLLFEPHRDCRRPQPLRGWGHDKGRRSIPWRRGREPFGWSSITSWSTRRSGRRSCRSQARSAVRRRRFGVGYGGLNAIAGSGQG